MPPGACHVPRHRDVARRADDRMPLRGVPLERSARPAPAAVDPSSRWTAGRRCSSTRPPTFVSRRSPTTSRAWTPCSSPTATPTTSWGSTSCGGSTCIGGRRLPVYAAPATATELRRIFSYAFAPPAGPGGGVPELSTCTRSTGRSRSQGVAVQPVPILHGPQPILGFRIGRFAYLTDCNAVPAVVDGAAWRPRRPGARRAAPPSAPDALLARRGGGGRHADQRPPDLLHAHLPRPAACRDLRQPAGGHGARATTGSGHARRRAWPAAAATVGGGAA